MPRDAVSRTANVEGTSALMGYLVQKRHVHAGDCDPNSLTHFLKVIRHDWRTSFVTITL